jgi:hypothetical protein
MSTQRRVTTPPNNQAEAVTDSLRPDSPGTPGSTATLYGHDCAPVSPYKEFSLDSAPWITRLCPGFLANLIFPCIPGVG